MLGCFPFLLLLPVLQWTTWNVHVCMCEVEWPAYSQCILQAQLQIAGFSPERLLNFCFHSEGEGPFPDTFTHTCHYQSFNIFFLKPDCFAFFFFIFSSPIALNFHFLHHFLWALFKHCFSKTFLFLLDLPIHVLCPSFYRSFASTFLYL